jgi:hypothetical protein
MACSRFKSETNKGKRFETISQALAGFLARLLHPTDGLYAPAGCPSRVLTSEEAVNQAESTRFAPLFWNFA